MDRLNNLRQLQAIKGLLVSEQADKHVISTTDQAIELLVNMKIVELGSEPWPYESIEDDREITKLRQANEELRTELQNYIKDYKILGYKLTSKTNLCDLLNQRVETLTGRLEIVHEEKQKAERKVFHLENQGGRHE